MPRYYFHVMDGVSHPDTEGIELSDLKAAQIEAVRFSAQSLSETADTFWETEEWKLNVTDGGGLVLFCVQITGMHAPVTQR